MRLTEQAAEAAYLSADFEAMDRLADNGLRNARTWEDKVGIYQVEIAALTAQNRLPEAIDMAGEILGPLGVSLPGEPGPADIDQAIREVDRALDGRSIESLATLGRAASAEPHGSALRILDSIHTTARMSRQMLAPLIAAKMVYLTLRHGHIRESINGYLFYGIFLCERGDIEQGYRFGQLARAVAAQEEQSEAQIAELSSNGYYHIFHWKEHIRALIGDMKKGYRAGLDAGRISVALNCLFNSAALVPFIAGMELPGVVEQMRAMVAIGEQHKQGPYLTWLRVYWQCALNFMRDSDDPCVLAGEAYDEGEQLTARRASITISRSISLGRTSTSMKSPWLSSARPCSSTSGGASVSPATTSVTPTTCTSAGARTPSSRSCASVIPSCWIRVMARWPRHMARAIPSKPASFRIWIWRPYCEPRALSARSMTPCVFWSRS